MTPKTVNVSETESAGRNVIDFSNSRVFVIGASRGGIGASIARAFQNAGAQVQITGIEDEPIRSDLERFKYTKLDVTDASSVQELAEQTGNVDVLVNCAAITKRDAELDEKFFAHVIDVNLQGTMRCALAFWPGLKAAKGCIINIASMYARFGSPRNPAYGASKAAVEQLTKSLAIAWAPDGIRVNAIAPGFIITEQSEGARQNPEFVETVEKRTPMGRWGQPADIAGAALFLASSAASFITGVCMPVDGGYSVA